MRQSVVSTETHGHASVQNCKALWLGIQMCFVIWKYVAKWHKAYKSKKQTNCKRRTGNGENGELLWLLRAFITYLIVEGLLDICV